MVKTDEQRGPVGAWAREQRIAREWAVEDVVERLEEPVTPVWLRAVEAGQTQPGAVRLSALSRLFGSQPPRPAPGPTLAERVAALEKRVAELEEERR